MTRLLLALILLAGLALRLWSNDYGLPFVYSVDEASHFTSRAVEMFQQGFDPGYYQNPAAFTYLLHAVLRALYGPLGFIFDLPFGNVTSQFEQDPTEIWVVARSLAAVLCMAGVAAAYAAGRRLWGTREGLAAAALLSFSFLPVAYSRVAVTDVGALMGIALSLLFADRARERGRLGDYALAGAAGGLAAAFKYTAALALLPLGIAALARLRADRARVLAGLALAGLGAVAAFVALNPYLFVSFDQWWGDLRDQAEVARSEPKPGQESGGVSYYLHSLTWGLGWAGIVAALAGAVLLLLRRDIVRGLMLVSVPLALFLYLSVQSRYFGRWLLPAYPALALLAGLALVTAADALHRALRRSSAARSSRTTGSRGAVYAILLALLVAITVAQPLAAGVRTAQVLGREDTLSQARDWLDDRYAPGLRVSIEPGVPGRYFRSNPEGRIPDWLSRCPRRSGWTEPGWSYEASDGRRVCVRFKPGLFVRPDGGVRASAYHSVLSAEVVDELRFYGYCLVMTVNVVRERALESGDPEARAYYERLERDSTLLREFSPYDRGAEPVPFNFDLSYNYYPTAYHRPGPTVRIHRLDDCRQRYGPSLIRVPRAKEPPPFG